MLIGGYKIRNIDGIHFVTLTIVEWIGVFTRQEYRDLLLDSLKYCQKEKGLEIHAWCIMSNHLHMIISAKNSDTSDILRDFKKFTSKKIIKAIIENSKESRKEWMIKIFEAKGQENSRNKFFQFWIQDNHPVELFSRKFILQRMNYLHNNPVKANLVDRADEYIYSSARDYSGRSKGLLDIVPI
ncbi:MAG: transposase [Bacteroidetes bacterium]|nr:transposase [Bacteroidota bacterium]